jgi:hypothetical protein
MIISFRPAPRMAWPRHPLNYDYHLHSQITLCLPLPTVDARSVYTLLVRIMRLKRGGLWQVQIHYPGSSGRSVSIKIIELGPSVIDVLHNAST